MLISQVITEEYVKSKVIANNAAFSRFGLTNCGIMLLAENKYLVLTGDLQLHYYLKAFGIDTVNFNNLRSL
ncbi:hypothetical protein [Myxosarcina sp. GI1]|uniref:hypothetical protein n=1 Tax=Myxosarcina sp. GI1 TaxID=1541065 RepID=UPI00068D9542|nr:hypothetical protein [Myxosarcina sp. GI1]